MVSTNPLPSPAVPAKLPRVVVYLPHQLKAELEELAETQHRPVSNLLLVLIEQAVKDAKARGEIQGVISDEG